MPTAAVPAVATQAPDPATSNVVLIEREVGNRIPRSEDEILPLPESVVHRLNVASMPEREVRVADVGPVKPAATMTIQDAIQLAKSAEMDAPGPIRITPTPETAPFRTVSTAEREVTAPVTTTPPARVEPVRIVANHKVQSGESLGKIAARYYGRATPSRINAIFSANRDRLTSVHAVRVGDELRIPAIPDVDGVAFADASDFAPARISDRRNERDDEIRFTIPKDLTARNASRAASASEAAPERAPSRAPAFEWYIVKENDTLSRIAKEEMRSARMYLKLYEANRDILPNKNTLKPGMKIRVPTDAQASAAGLQ